MVVCVGLQRPCVQRAADNVQQTTLSRQEGTHLLPHLGRRRLLRHANNAPSQFSVCLRDASVCVCVCARARVRSRLLLEHTHEVATCNMQHATDNMRHATCNRQQTTRNMQQVRTSRGRQPTAGLCRSSARHPAAIASYNRRQATCDTREGRAPSAPPPLRPSAHNPPQRQQARSLGGIADRSDCTCR
jgi:hypothetical protein